MVLEIITYLLIIAGSFLTYFGYKKSLVVSASEDSVRFTHEFKKLLEQKKIFFSQVDLLFDHSNRYFQTLNDAGLPEALKIRDQLVVVIEELRAFESKEKFKEALKLIDYLTHPTQKLSKEVSVLSATNLKELHDWKERANQHVTACVIKLGITSNAISENLDHEQMRRKTIHSLEQLRNLINADRVNTFQDSEESL